MFMNPQVTVSLGPPPQAVLNKRPCWRLFMVCLTVVAILRLVTLDIVGALLSALMVAMAAMMLSDGMAELPKYAMVFAMLCGLCFFFDGITLLSSLPGRSDVEVDHVTTRTSPDATSSTIVYTTTVKTTPLFDSQEGWFYNLTSLSFVLSPVVMALGSYLSLHAHSSIESVTIPFVDDGADEPNWLQQQLQQPGLQHLAASGSTGAVAGSGSAPTVGRFEGTPRKLG
eukprot:TRINITY_DN7280_c1_g1_i1.p1 TRINITY_DN7280_c1_g1~~TRINITY_DN7280_c1_g1_i1.p1  ORF type:complete len:227 (-),score=17.19 TRINITY_DN7280_c1_g1_i1:156-836(-)